MGISKFCNLNDEQFLALFLYVKKFHAKDGAFRAFVTPNPSLHQLLDIADDFNKHLGHNFNLQECYKAANRMING